MTIAQGVVKQTRFKRQTAKGTIATTSAGQILRRKTSVFELQIDIFNSKDEITSTRQLISSRHGEQLVNGQVEGLLSPGTYSDLIGALLRRDFAAITAISGASITIANGSVVGGVQQYTLTDGSNTFLTKGVTIGSVLRLTAGAFNAANLNNNILVMAVTQTVITGITLNGSALVAEGPIATATVSLPGKTTYAPNTGHTAIYYTVEEWSSDVPSSEVFTDVRFGQAQITLPGQGNATIQLQAQGLGMSTPSSSVYFTAPTTETTTGIVSGATGLLVAGTSLTPLATVTDLQFTITGNQAPADPVVGTNTRPDIFVGKIMLEGTFTAYFDSLTMMNNFINESVLQILSVQTADSTNAADFIAWSIPQLNLDSATPTDGETGLKRSYKFTAEYFAAGGAALSNRQTTIQVQDSQAT